MAFAVKRFNTILTDMITTMVALQDAITDFNEGSITRSTFEAIALEIEADYIKTRVGFGVELKEVPFYAFDFPKEGAQYAGGDVVFTRTGTTGDVTIPTGTILSTSDGVQFETTAQGTILDGNTESAAVSVTAIDEGADGNVSANTIIIIVTTIAGVDGVYNSAAMTGGLDEENSDEHMGRFRDFIEGLGQANVAGLITGAKQVEGVRSASVVEHFPPVSGYNVTVYVDDGAGNASQAMVDAVTAILVGDGTASNPGYKGGGINLRTLAPTKINIAVTVVLTVSGTISEEATTYLAEQALFDYVNNLSIGADVIRNKIIDVLMGVQGVIDLTLTLPSGNTVIGNDQIARTSSSIINITYT